MQFLFIIFYSAENAFRHRGWEHANLITEVRWSISYHKESQIDRIQVRPSSQKQHMVVLLYNDSKFTIALKKFNTICPMVKEYSIKNIKAQHGYKLYES